jgi:hypothetical protein
MHSGAEVNVCDGVQERNYNSIMDGLTTSICCDADEYSG